MAMNTSISDDGRYPEFCYLASKHEELFNNFKQHPIYTRILEHVTPEQGLAFLHFTLENLHKIQDFDIDFEQFNIFLQNDNVGNPRTASYNIGDITVNCSPTTLRYIKVLSDIALLFDFENIKCVSEIGIGYAGQCRILINSFNIDEYNLIDLPEVLALAEKFLDKLKPEQGGSTAVRYFDGTHLYYDINADLLISNYAFSELSKPVQDIYLRKVILNSKRGYITWNNLSADHMDAYSLEDILSIIPNSKIIPERPLTYFKNCIIVWGTK